MINVDHSIPRASSQDGTHPRPQVLRRHWADLCGVWDFTFDDADRGAAAGWHRGLPDVGSIIVPFPPESDASGVGDTRHHRIAWYARSVGPDHLARAGHSPSRRLMLRFGAVDYRARVWVDGQLVGVHEGGHTPFSVDVTDALGPDDQHVIVVRAEDDPIDVTQPRGKQDWRESPHVIWYNRTSGIWQPVWLESVPAIAIETLHWTTDLHTASATARICLSARANALPVRVQLDHGGMALAGVETTVTGSEIEVTVPIAADGNGQAYEELLWSPEHPNLIDAVVQVGDDIVSSYLGIRTAEVAHGRFVLNDRPYYIRSVLSQGYWPTSHLAAPSADALKDEVALIKSMGFNAARLHQKFEDPRLLHWADRLGLLVWGEAPASYTFSPTAVERMIREWLEVVRRDYSHPSIVTWVPLNESWGVQHISHNTSMQHYARSLVEMTKALDPTRPVVSNDGWEQVDTDIVAIHDYEDDPAIVRERYRDRAAIDRLTTGFGPAGRRLILSGDIDEAPVMLTEFGGISFDVDKVDEAWGYSSAQSPEDFEHRLKALLDAVHASSQLAGFCYTQFADTLQETNGLARSDRSLKLPVERLRAIVTGSPQS